MESNLPATGSETGLVEAGERAPDQPAVRPPSQPLSVAFLPLALLAFVVLAFVIAAWTFLAAGA
jgi:hypothetical protein